MSATSVLISFELFASVMKCGASGSCAFVASWLRAARASAHAKKGRGAIGGVPPRRSLRVGGLQKDGTR
eukprot:6182102-Pleurochrysis_carterae.AAC.3